MPMTVLIHLKLYASLARFRPAQPHCYPVPNATDVDQLVSMLDLPREEVKLIFVNGRRAAANTLLAEGDRVGIFPPVGGG